MDWAAICERYQDGFLGQPADAATSLAFVVAGAGILIARRGTRGDPTLRGQRTVYGLLVAGVGVGSFVQHGPHPDWQAYAHDLPLAAVLVFVAADAASDLLGRDLPQGWWLVPSMLMVPVIAAGPAASTGVQAVMATAAIGLNLARVRRHPAVRGPVISALGTAAAGSAIGALTDHTSLCRAGSLVQGHAAWHLLAAAALWLLAPAVGARRRRAAEQVWMPTEPAGSPRSKKRSSRRSTGRNELRQTRGIPRVASRIACSAEVSCRRAR